MSINPEEILRKDKSLQVFKVALSHACPLRENWMHPPHPEEDPGAGQNNRTEACGLWSQLLAFDLGQLI